MVLVSVVIITYNEESNIGRCIESVRDVADEIIVLDSFSTDGTAFIARGLGATVYYGRFNGYINQKNAALEFATNDFVLSLDADEALSPELVASINTSRICPAFKAYRMNRSAFYCGKFIRYGTWYPEPKIRLFDRKAVRWGGIDPHDRIIHPSTMQVGSLDGDILHYICDTVEKHRARTENFSTLAARSLYQLGRTTNWFRILGSPAWFFIFDYFIRGGMFSGWRGWKIATLQARYHYLKYLKLWRLRKGAEAR